MHLEWEVVVHHETALNSEICVWIKKTFTQDSENVENCKWSSYNSIKNVCVFIDLCVYYQLWIKNFAFITESIYNLFKKNCVYYWNKDQQKTTNKLKIVLLMQFVIWLLNYDKNVEDIILIMNSNLKEWSFCLI